MASKSLLIGAGVALAIGAGTTLAVLQTSPSREANVISGVSPSPTGNLTTANSTKPRAVANSTPSQVTPASTTSQAAPSSPASRPNEPEVCRISTAIVTDPNPPLNVRSRPDANADNVVASLANGTYVSVIGEESGWFQISNPVEGWVAKNRTEYSCSQRVETIQFSDNGEAVTFSSRLIGGGSHKYRFSAVQGQTLTVNGLEGPFPMIINPQEQVLAGDPSRDSDRTQWTGQIPASGIYTLELISNFKGFEYSFSAQLR